MLNASLQRLQPLLLRATDWLAEHRPHSLKLSRRSTRHVTASVHPRRAHIHLSATFGEQAADAIAEGMGSWRFIITQTVVVALWMTLNVVGLIRHWDAYPFILLNLLFSTQAAYAAPIIMMSQNRQSAKDRVRDDTEAQEVEQMFAINQQQLAILEQQDEILALLKAHTVDGAPATTTTTTSTEQERQPARTVSFTARTK